MLNQVKDILGIGNKILETVIPNKTEQMKAKSELARLVHNKELTLAKLGVSAVIAEAQGESWLQKNWRPLAMVNFLLLIDVIVVSHIYGISFDRELVQGVLNILLVGLGGYVFSRGAEKVSKTVADGMKAKHTGGV